MNYASAVRLRETGRDRMCDLSHSRLRQAVPVRQPRAAQPSTTAVTHGEERRWHRFAPRCVTCYFLPLAFDRMKTTLRLLVFCCLLSAPLVAQLPTESPVDVLRHPGWSTGVFIGGSQSFATTPSAQTFLAGARLGRVLTGELGHSALRGSFEMAVDLIPVNEFWVGGHAQYAAAIDPFIVKWNFTNGCKISPYLAAVGGIVFSTSNLPPGDTSTVNFTSGAELGLQWFRHDRGSIDFAAKVYHLSNASIGNKNPGINGAVQFMLGYTWH